MDHGRTPKSERRSTQVSRLSAPLVNEVVIGLPDKDRSTPPSPSNDAQFAKYVTNPTLPELIQVLFPACRRRTCFRAPTWSPRS